MPKKPTGKALPREAIGLGPALVLAGLAITCLVPAVNNLDDGKVMAGRTLLVVTWLLGTWALSSVRSIRDRWRWGALVVTLSVFWGVVLLGYAVTQSRRPHAVVAENRHSPPPPQGREKPRRGRSVETAVPTAKAASKPIVVAPSAPQRVPLIPPGAKVTQKNVNGDNYIAGRDMTINPEVNPYAPVVTYDFNGAKRVSKSGGSDREVTLGEACQAFQEMESLRNAQRWKPLAKLCETEIRAAPEWLTPYLYAGEAYMNLGDRKKAIERLEYVEKRAANDPQYKDATRWLEQLRRTRN